jgi:hypothetical protein
LESIQKTVRRTGGGADGKVVGVSQPAIGGKKLTGLFNTIAN